MLDMIVAFISPMDRKEEAVYVSNSVRGVIDPTGRNVSDMRVREGVLIIYLSKEASLEIKAAGKGIVGIDRWIVRTGDFWINEMGGFSISVWDTGGNTLVGYR